MSSTLSKISRSGSSSGDEEVVDQLRRGPWTLEEDTLLVRYISCHGEGHWNLLAKRSGLRRAGKSCRLRWLNYLKPDVKRGNLTSEEQLLILQLHAKWGNRWAKIAQYLPGRTDNEIKNYWRTRVQKQARHLKIDCNSREFQELIRCFWMPRLLQKIQGSSSPSTTQSQNLTAANQQVYPTSHVDKSESGKTSCSNDRLALTEDSTLLESSILSSQLNSTIICSADESVKITSNAPRISEYPTSPLIQGMGNINEEYQNNPFLEGFYKADHNISSYDIESFSMSTMEEAPTGDFGNSLGCWIDNELPESMWNMDEEF